MEDSIITATEEWHHHLDAKANVAVVFFDLSKALDSILYLGLLRALSRIGVSGYLHRWFSSYLTGRSQRVVLDGCSSACLPVHSGVPQGSILGPLLLSIYINPLASLSLSSSTRLLLYADDILLYKPIRSAWDLLSLQCDIDMVSDWISSAGLRLNVTKTKLMAISQKKARPSFNLFANGSLISQVLSHVYLGVTLTDDLTFNRNINNTCLKAGVNRAYCIGSSVWPPHLL